MAIESFFANLSLFIVSIFVLNVWHAQNLISCLIFELSNALRCFGTLISLALISQVRYFIALKTSKMKAYNKKKLQFFITTFCVFSFFGIIVAFIVCTLNGAAPLIDICTENEIDEEKTPWLFIIMCPFIILIVLSNLLGDILMLMFIWKRKNKIKPTKLIPWKSKSKAEENDMTVPVHATILSITSLIVMIISFILINFNVKGSPLLPNSIMFPLLSIYMNVVIPYVMLFKIIKTKKIYPSVPKGLQRYGEESEDEFDKSFCTLGTNHILRYQFILIFFIPFL